MLKVQKRINQLENEPCVRRYNDLADYWYVFDDILEFVFEIQNPRGWLEGVKRNPVLWIQLSDYLFEFPIENPLTKLIEQKQCTTEYRLWLFLDSVSKYKVLNCSHGVCGTVAKRHEKLGIDSSEWHRRIEQLGVKGKLNPAAIKAIEYELMSDTARAKIQVKNRYESMSKIDRWLHDVTQYTISQAIAENQRPEDVAAVVEDMKERMNKFGRTVKNDLDLSF